MPIEAFLDLSKLDLSREVYGRAELDKYLAQRGTFQVVDRIIHDEPEAGLIVGVKDIRADDWWASDHIPGRPMFPGALMIETAAQIASFDYAVNRADPATVGQRFVGFGGVDNVRFRGMVTPGCLMVFIIKLVRAGSRMFRYSVQGFTAHEGVIAPNCVFDGEVLGVVL